MLENILETIKKLLGIVPDDTSFDDIIVTHINSAFSTLYQLGFGKSAYYMEDPANDVWSDAISSNEGELNFVKTYIYLKVRLVFDPPQNSFVTEAIKEQIKELEWRINAATDFEAEE